MAPLSGERLKVLMTADCVGGVWRYAVDLCTAAKPHGVEPVIAGLGPRPRASQEREAFRAGIQLVWLDAELDWVAAGSPALEQAARLLNRVIDDLRPDVLHLNTPALAHLAAAEIPCVAALHSCVASWWAAVRGTALPAEWEWNRQNVERGLRAATRVVVPTQAFAEAVGAIYGPRPTLEVVHNGSAAGDPASLSNPKEPAVMAVGRWWDEAKNLAALSEAAPEIAWPVLAAGPLEGPNGTRAEAGPLHALGELSAEACAEQMSRAALFVSPAIYEPFGLSVLEAAGRGAALALADIPTFRELWDEAALFFPPRDARCLAETVNRLIEDRTLRAELAAKAFERAALYSLDAQAQAMVRTWSHASGKRSLAA
jgi:glycosyltransferase involved in cell wall biosynthesis